VFWTFHEAVRGLSDACRAFGVPVISGNVSFYNESFGKAIYPTPVVGLVGVLEDASKRVTMAFKDSGDVIVLLGETDAELGGTEYLKVVHGLVAGRPPAVDLAGEKAVHTALLEAIGDGLVRSAHDCSEGGVAVALAECCIVSGLGATVTLDDDLPAVDSLFSETQGRVIVTCAEADAERLIAVFSHYDVAWSVIGEVGGDRLDVAGTVNLPVEALRAAWEPTLAGLVHGDAPLSEELREG
jgi:phosphoribosylformylglycinamidine (FGAM) synthase-like enzyme